ncbi:MAG: hypothetical protein WBE93_00635, partial [Pseudolabrys sp.]
IIRHGVAWACGTNEATHVIKTTAPATRMHFMFCAPTVFGNGMAYFGVQIGCGQGTVRFWHLADIPLAAIDVRYRG